MDWFNKQCAKLKSQLAKDGYNDFENNEIAALVLLGMATQATVVGLDNEVTEIEALISKALTKFN